LQAFDAPPQYGFLARKRFQVAFGALLRQFGGSAMVLEYSSMVRYQRLHHLPLDLLQGVRVLGRGF
jgi:hypothetical protein